MHPPSNLDDVPVVFFRVMRLVSPELNLAHPLRLDLSSDVMPDDSPLPTPQRPSTEQIPHQAFADRILLGTYHDMSGMDGALKLPSSFGSTYLGETLHCLINVGNQSEASLSQVTLKVEVATTRQKTLLFPTDPEMPPLPSLAPGACHSFAIRHDLRETGLHSITCSALFSRHDGERKYMQNHFKFPVLNPLTVRTKLRHGRGRVLMEVSLQNDTGRPLLLDSVRLDAPVHLAMETVASRSAAPQLKAASASSASGGTGKHPHSTELPYQNHLMLELRRLLASASATDTTGEEGASVVPLQEGEGLGSEAAQEAQQQQELEEEEEELQGAGPLSSYIDSLQLVAADGGIRNYVFMLRRDAQRPLASPKDSRYMGRVDIRWRRGMGELGRLQTQAIATPSSLGGLQVEMLLEGCPQVAQVGTAFQVVLRIQSCLPEPCGPFWLRYQAARQPPASGQVSADTPGSAQGIPPCPVTVQGSSCRTVEQLAPQQSRQVQLQMVGLQPGLHVLRDFQLVNQRNPAELLCVLDPPEVFVV